MLRTYSVVRDSSVSYEPGEVIDGPHAAARIIRRVFDTLDADREHFVVFACDVRMRVVGYKVVGQGTASACIVHPREVFHAAITLGAHSLILAHNHPSGDPSPSREDLALHERMTEAGTLLGFPVLDGLVLGDERTWSMAERGTLR